MPMHTRNYSSIILQAMLLTSLMAIPLVDACSETRPDADVSAQTITAADDGLLRTVPFITLRNKTGSDNVAQYYGGERSPLTAGYCELSRKPINSIKPIADIAPFYIPDEIVNMDAVRETSLAGFWQRMTQSSNGHAPVLYTHGFNIDFEKGCKRALILKESLGLKGRFALFSWPSDGSLTNYTHDEADLYWSVLPLREILAGMVDHFGSGHTNLVAHSLGTRGVMLALVLLAQSQHDSRPLFNQLVLIAPDIDVSIFKQYLPIIRPLVRHITVYVSANDSPLALSRQLHGYPRLGEAGEHLEGLSGIDIIDLSDIPQRAPSGHIYHLHQSLVTEDLDQLINDNKTAAQRSKLKQVSDNRWRMQPSAADTQPR